MLIKYHKMLTLELLLQLKITSKSFESEELHLLSYGMGSGLSDFWLDNANKLKVTFSDIFEDIVIHVSSRVFNKHATTEHNTLELVVLNPWRRIVSGDESNETSIDVVIVKSW